MNNFICHKNGELYSVLNAAQILVLNRPYEVAHAALVEAGVSDPDEILNTQAQPEVYWPTLANSLSVTGENSRIENEALRANVDALTDYVGQLASEIEVRDARETLRKRIAALESTIRSNIPAYRQWLQSNSLPQFDVNNDELVRLWAIGNTKLGKELTKLKGILNV